PENPFRHAFGLGRHVSAPLALKHKTAAPLSSQLLNVLKSSPVPGMPKGIGYFASHYPRIGRD
ncbi:MAG TPA: hypothetical protein PLJ71_16685, partial [Candidatus Hydrogenedentes bacterium]|nr:hypothetical protein [Candidatus Hydrogenedentota bacterium]HQM50326.1 hypothetical protein [Candidatus Hydrogenedentota bacterium]